MLWGYGDTHVNVQPAKVLPELLLLLRTDVLEVLVTEDHHAPLRNQQCELSLLGISQLRELESADFSADSRRQASHHHIWIIRRQQIWFCWVGI